MAALLLPSPFAFKKKERGRGFTFVELLIVLVLIGIFLAVSLPELKKRAQHALLHQEARTATQFLRYAQYRAVADRAPVAFALRPAENQYQLMKDEGKAEAIHWIPIPGEWGRPVHLKSELISEASPEGIVYFPDGSSAGGGFRLRHQKSSAQLTVKPGLGHVQVNFENEK